MLQEDLHGYLARYDLPYTGGLPPGPVNHQKPLKFPSAVHIPASSTYKVLVESPPRKPEKEMPHTSSNRSITRAHTPQPQVPPPSPDIRKANRKSQNSSPHPVRTANEKEDQRLKPPRSAKASRTGPPDPEKAFPDHESVRSHPSSNAHSHQSTIIYEEEDDHEDSAHDPSKHVVRILIFLSTLAPFLSLTITFYALLATSTILLLSPLCVLTSRLQSLRNQFLRFLVPPSHFQLKLIFSPYDTTEASPPTSISRLLLTTATAPFVAIGVSVATWVAASFWVFAKILGDPMGAKDERNDGRAAVLGVRRFWEGWLVRGLR